MGRVRLLALASALGLVVEGWLPPHRVVPGRGGEVVGGGRLRRRPRLASSLPPLPEMEDCAGPQGENIPNSPMELEDVKAQEEDMVFTIPEGLQVEVPPETMDGDPLWNEHYPPVADMTAEQRQLEELRLAILHNATMAKGDIHRPVDTVFKEVPYIKDWFAAVRTDTAQPPVVDWLEPLRAAGKRVLTDGTVLTPTKKMEAWRFSNFQMAFGPKYLAPMAGDVAVTRADLEEYFMESKAGAHLVFVDGVFAPELSDLTKVTGQTAGLYVGGLADLPAEAMPRVRAVLETMQEVDGFDPRVKEDETKYQPGADVHGQKLGVDFRTALGSAPLAAAHQACFSDSAVVLVPDGAEVDMQVVFVSTAPQGRKVLSHPRLFVGVGEDATLDLAHTHVGMGPGTTHFTNAVTNVEVGARSTVHHSYTQESKAHAQHFEAMAVLCHEDAKHTLLAVTMGGRQSRVNVGAHLNGARSTQELFTVFMAGEQQMSSLHSMVTHSEPDCISRQQHRNIVGRDGEAVFKGRIKVQREAQGSDSEQLCKTLLLDDSGKVTMMPWNEIIADQVAITHGATCADLSDDEIFYLQARGIDTIQARVMLISAFVAELTQAIKCQRTRGRIHGAIDRLVPTYTEPHRKKKAEWTSM